MTTWTTTTKNISSYANKALSGILTYFSAEDETIYLTGADEEDSLVTQKATDYVNLTKN
jgi:hypothetical protein